MHRNILLKSLGVFLVWLLVACASQQGAVDLRTGLVERGSIDSLVSATGNIYPQERVNLSFDQPNIVQSVLIEVGDVVKAGDELAHIDSSSLELGVRQAELAYEIQRLSYERLFVPPSEAEIAAARASVESAYAAYQLVAQGADPEQVRIAQLQYEQAFNTYLRVDMQLRAVQWYMPDDALLPLREQVDQALLSVELARLRLEQAKADPDQYALLAEAASVAQAQAQLDRLLEGPSDLEIALAQTQLNQAQLAVDRAKQTLASATLLAPISGSVAQVNVRPGMPTPSNQPAIVLLDASHLHVEVEVDEIDIGQIAPGQSAMIMVDALPAETLSGQVVSIAPSATVSGGTVTYRVRIDLNPTELPIRSGMTATADIVVQRIENVLLVPNWALRIDRATGVAYASILADDGTVQEVEVVLGLRGSSFSQVMGGLEAGQTVAVNLAHESLDFFGGEQP